MRSEPLHRMLLEQSTTQGTGEERLQCINDFLGHKVSSSQTRDSLHTSVNDAEMFFLMICIDYIKGFQTQMYSRSVLWINSPFRTQLNKNQDFSLEEDDDTI